MTTHIKTRDLIVDTIGGNRVERKKCIKIKEKFHEKNVDCFVINDLWISKHYNKIEIDDFSGNYNFVTKLGKHIKDLRWDNSASSYIAEFGFTSRAHPAPFTVKGFKTPIQVLNEEIYNKFQPRLKPCRFSGEMCLDGRSNHVTFIKYNHERDNYDHVISLGKAVSRAYPKIQKQALGLISDSYLTTEGLQYTFGIEIETCAGLLPADQAADLGLNIKAEQDGSIIGDDGRKYGGAEYITGVLKGDSGFRQLKILCKELTLRTKVNSSCSVHVHLGNIVFDDEFIMYMYILAKKIERELFSYMASNRFTKDGEKPNPYCKPLQGFRFSSMKNLNKEEYNEAFKFNYNKVVEFLASGNPIGERFNRSTNHPQGSKCGYDKTSPRYSWLNLIPTYFDTRGDKTHTIEFRMMGETTSYIKIKAWALICMAISWFVENHKTDILNGYIGGTDKKELNVLNILRLAYPKKGEMLCEYLLSRHKSFSRDKGMSEIDFYIDDNTNFERVTLNDIANEAYSLYHKPK